MDTNYSSGVLDLILRVQNNGPTNRAVVRFDLSTIPSDAAAKTATLSLFAITVPSSSRTYAAFRITAPWVENQVTWNSRATGTPWGTAGGDLNAGATATTTTGTAAGVWRDWNILADVKLWLAGTTNNGTLIRDGTESGPTRITEFASNINGTAANRPKLVVTYLRTVTGLTPTAGSGQVALGWVHPGSSPDYNGTLIIRRAGSAPTSTPTDGTVYTAGSSTLADGSLVVFNDTTSCTPTCSTAFTDTGLTNGTTYYYQAFTRDSSNRYSFASATVSATPVTCGAVADATYAAVSATSTGATVYWSSANPVLILRQSGGSVTGTPVGGTTYSAGNGLGPSTVVYSGSVAEKSVLDTVAGRTTTDRYKVLAKGAGPCYAPGLQADASVPAGTAWSYAMASLSGNSMLKPGIAGNGTIYPSSMSSRIIALSTADGTRSWDPISSTGAIQGWLTWLPVGGDVTSGLVGHWKLDEGSGPTAADSSGSGNTGTWVNSPTPTTGKINGGLSLGGVNSYVDLPNITGGTSTGTVSAWVKFNSVTWGVDGTSVYHHGASFGPGDDQLMLGAHPGTSSGNNLMFGLYNAGPWMVADSGLIPSTGRWYHLVGSWGPQGLKIYIDGVLKGTNSYTGSVTNSVTDQIGCNSHAGSCVNGLIDDVRVYNRALSAAEVSKLHLRGGGWQYRKKITIDRTRV
ncbi:MAG: LamG-like jellyroll fold domain-containing protein, partial [Thermoanaerobaculia bacterium]